MGDYVVKFVDNSTGLAHWRPKGSKNGVITRYVGKYYIPKGIRNKASEIKKMRKMDADELEDYLDDRHHKKDVKKNGYKAMTDEELAAVNKRKGMEAAYRGYIKKEKAAEAENENKKTTEDLVKSAKDINQTLANLNDKYKRNPPTKKQEPIDLSEKSDMELRKVIERARLEQQYNDVVNKPQVDTGKIKVAAALSAIGTAAVVGTQVANFVVTAKKLK